MLSIERDHQMYKKRFRKLYSIGITTMLILSSLISIFLWDGMDSAAAENPLTPISTITGPDKGDNFGWNVSWVGDVNGDGYDDIIAGAPYADRYLGGDWWDNAWSYRRKLIFDNSGQSEDLVNFPVLVTLRSINFDYSKAKSDGIDLRFIDEDGVTELNYDIEFWNSSGNSFIWVNVTRIDAGSSTDYIWMYYGNPVASDGQNKSGTYDSSYVGVWHLNEIGSGTADEFKDSTSYNNDGQGGSGTSGYVPTRIEGKIGGGQDFDGIDDHINSGYSTSLDIGGTQITLEAWINFAGYDPSHYIGIMSHGGWTEGYRLVIRHNGNPLYFHLPEDASWLGASQDTPTDSWVHVVCVYNGSKMIIYINGIKDSNEQIKTDNIETTPNEFWIGHGDNLVGETYSYPWNGSIDEVRVSNIARSSDWIKVQHLSMNDTFITFGNEETRDWWNSGWLYRKKLIFDNSGQSEDLVNFPILVNLSASNFDYSKAKLDGTDLRFIDEDGVTELKYHIEDWNSSGNSFVWVNVTNIAGGSSTDYIWMYYGNSAAPDVQDVSGTYDESYVGVWHLNETTGNALDSTSYNIDGTPSGGVTQGTTGQIDGAYDFDGVDGNVYMGDPADGHLDFGNRSFTISLWANIDQNTGTWQSLLYKGGGSVSTKGYLFETVEDGSRVYVSLSDGSSTEISETVNIAFDTWFYLTGVINRTGNLLHVYKDGSEVGFPVVISAIGNLDTTAALQLSFTTYPANTIIDEVRISNIARSLDWIKAQYLSINDTFITYGGEESIKEDCGAAYIFFGYPGITLNNIDAANANITIYGSNAGDLLGWSVSDAGDVNNDGYDDIIIGAPGWGADRGRAYIFHGRATGSWNNVYDADSDADVILTGENDGDKFGFSVSGAGNIHSDGLSGEFFEGWFYRKKITINSSQVADDLTDFPMLIRFIDSDLKSRARLDGFDIFFTESDGKTKLDHEIERYNNSSGELVAWVKIPFLSSTIDTTIYIYYGNSDASDQSNPTGVWSNSYRGVWHLSEISGNALDSTFYSTNGTISGTVTQGDPGKIDGAYTLEPNGNDNVDMGNPADGHLDFGLGNFTLSVWVMDYPYTNYQNIVFKGSRSSSFPMGYSLYHRPNDGEASWSIGDTTARAQNDFDWVQDGSWRYIVGVANRFTGLSHAYVNGVEQGTAVDISSIGSVDSDFNFAIPGSSSYLDAIIDEVRISSCARSAKWIETEFNNQNDTSTFYTVGNEEIIPVNWLYRKPVIVNASQVTGDLTDFPMLIDIMDTDLKNKADSDGYDIIFTESDGRTRLDHEIESYNSSSGELIAWVRIPSLSSSSDTIIYMYYGNSGINSPTEDPSGVWDVNYRGVWHLSEESGNAIDSTTYGTSGTLNGAVTQSQPGKLGYAYDFGGAGAYVDMGDPADGHLDFGNESFTYSTWVYIDVNTGTWEALIYKGGNTAAIQGYGLETSSSVTNFRHYISDSSTQKVSTGTSLALDTWYHLVMVIDRSSNLMRFYRNSTEVTPAIDINSFGSVNSTFALSFSRSISSLDGLIDEVRIIKGVKTADWITTEYNNQNDTSTFYTLGNEEIIPQNWLYRKPITINASKVTGDLTDFPMLINIVDTDLKNKARTDGYDIIFTESDGRTRLNHEIESYDSSSGELVAWIRIPYLSSSSDTVIYMHYGNSYQILPTENPSGVWDDNYKGVWHLNDDLLDSTSNDQDGINGGSTNASGMFADGQEFDDTNYVYVPDFSSTIINSTLTLSGWVNAATPDGSHDGYFGIRNEVDADFYALRRSSGTEMEFRLRPSSGSSCTLVPFPQAISNQWHYLTLVYDGNDVRAYINGVQEGGIGSSSGYIINGSVDLFIGKDSNNNRMVGIIDEVRFSNISRSAGWIETEFNNQNDTRSFYTVGNEEINPENWLYRKPITLSSSKVTGDLTNFPVLINLIDTDLKNKARPDGYDILFTEEDGRTRLDHEIESYNSSTGELVAWVKVPLLSSSTDTVIYMYYGNSGQSYPTEDPEGVWDDNYNAVWHLSEIALGVPGDYKDSTSNSYDGEGGSGTPWRIPTRTTGKIGYGQNFDGINDIINCSSMNPMVYDDFTFEAWYKSNDNLPEKDEYIFAHRVTNPNGPGVVFSVTDDVGEEGHLRLSIYNTTADFECYYGTTNLTDMQYHHLVGVRENGFIRLYVDGVLESVLIDQHPGETLTVSTSNSPVIGDFPSSGEEVNGTLDEIRVSRVARSWDWINASYNNQDYPSTFYSIGPEEINPVNWLYRKPITINASKVAGDLTDFPMLIQITDTDLKSKARTDGYDIMFTESDGMTKLDHEIERYNSSSGELIAWVKIPFLSSSSGILIYMHYGNPDAPDQQNIEGVWSNGFVGVYHMVEETGNINNSASSTNDGTRFDTPTRTTGQIGYGQEFTGSGAEDYFNVGNLGIADGINENITISVWANVDNVATEDWGKIVSKRDETDDASTYRLQLTNDPDKRLSLELNAVSSDDCDIAKDTWVYITATYNGSVRYIFINETEVYSGALSGPLWDSSKNVYIGVRKKESSAPDYKFGGILDEVRLSKAARSASWIITEFNNQNDTSTFYSVGSEEQIGEGQTDNYDDVIVGAYGYGIDQGRAYIFYGGSGFTGEISAGNADVIINGTSPNDRLGWDVSRAGDVNNDGFGDVIIGAPGNNGDTGAAYIFLGDNNIPSLINDTDADVSIFGGSSGDEFGFSISFADDVNNDGFDDVIIGAPGNNSDCGVVYIFFGNSSINSLINVADANVIMLGESTGDKFGFSVHHAGDVNGDGVPDVIIGAPYHDDGATSDAGAVYVFEGGASMDNIIDWSFKGEQTNDHLGWSVSFTGNLCGDGSIYLIAGAPNNDDGGTDAGKTYILTIIANKPVITNVLATPSIQNIGGYVNITCDVTALSGVDEVWVNITLPGGGYNNVSMTQGVGNQWFYNNNYSIPGLYQYTIWAKDTLGNWTKSDVFQFQVINSPPLLSSPQVDPLTGYTDTGFNFTVVYTDLDNHAPNNITVNITSIGVYDLIEVDPSDTNYTDGKEYYYNTSGFSVGLYSFHFAANDTLGDWDETVEILGLQIFNTPPNLLSPDVDPLSGTSTTYFNFTVNYIDLDDHSPGNITLNLSGPSGGTFDLIEVDPLDTIYSDGKEYYYNTTLSNGSYSFHFAANDSYGNWYETAELSVPLVGISKPIFTESVVKPNSGYVDTWFNFTVNYSHPFDKGPDNITLNLTGPSGGIFDLIEVDPLDTNYTDGKLYYYNISGLSVGSYSFNFAANDTDGNWSESGIKGFEVLNRVPILALDQVNPITGFTDTGFNFTVNYMDLDNHAPDNLTLNITGVGIYDLIEVDPLDTDYRDGKAYYYNLSGFVVGTYSFRFAANDTIGNWTESGILQFDVLNREPMLSLGQVDPISGNINTWFNFTVMYTDPENHPPDIISVNITGVGIYDLIELDNLDIDYTDGKAYYYNLSGFAIGSYTFHFAANDTIGNWTETGILQFDVFNRAPILTIEQVNPTSGYIDTYFNFTVNYINLDDNAPFIIIVNITGVGVYDLIEIDPLDTNYMDGKDYYYNISGFAVGLYSFHFAANDTFGNWTESIVLQFEVINRLPTLSFGQVNPITGYIDTAFNFTIVYTDLDDHALDKITLNISSVGIYDLIETDSFDIDYTDGKEYYLNLSGFTLGQYSFLFAANDTLGNWVETGIMQFDVINRVPTLLFGQINPPVGDIDTWYNFSVIYTDLDDHSPDIITVNISGIGVYDLFALDPLDVDYTDGKIYYFNTSGFSIGSYSFKFAANDSQGDRVETIILNFDVIDRVPTLLFEQVDPNTGYTDTWFNFTVTYADLDNHAPNLITVNITGIGVYELFALDPMDMDYTDGKDYYYSLSGFAVGQYSLNFAVNDTLGNWVETGILQFDVLNRAPLLSLEQVDPTIGYTDTWFNFTVNYTDLDNHAPFNITLNLTGPSGGNFELVEVDPSDADYRDGKEYYYNTTLTSGLYSFHFAAIDLLGMWATETKEINSPDVIPKQGYLEAIDYTAEFSDEIYLNVTLFDNLNNPILDENIAFYIDKNKNGIYEAGEFVGAGTTSADGNVSVSCSIYIAPGIYNFNAIYIGSGDHVVNDDEALLIIYAKGATLTAISDIVEEDEVVSLTAILIDIHSNPISFEQVKFFIDKNKNGIYDPSESIGSGTTSAGGVALITYTVNLAPENYGIWAKYVGSSNYTVNEIEGLLTVQNIGNRPPSILGKVPDQIKPEDSLPWPLDLTSYEADLEDSGPDLKWYLTGIDTSLYSVTGMNSSDDIFTFIPVPDAFGNDEVMLWLWDSSGDRVSQVLWVNITPENDLPYFNPLPPNLFVHYDDPNTNDDDPIPWDYTFYVHDIETAIGDLIITTSEPTVNAGRGYAEVDGLKVTFHYPQDRAGESIAVFLTLSDGTDIAQTMIWVNVTSDWVPELVGKLPDIVLEENTTLYNVFDLDDYFIDKDHDSLYFSSGYFHINVNINENNTVDITAIGHWTGSELVTFRAWDPIGAIAEDTITVTVIPVNNPPVISGVPNLVVHYDYYYAFDLSPYIFDLDNHTYELIVWTSEPTNYIWLQQQNNLGIVVNYPEAMEGMTIPVTIYVSDGIEIASQQILINVTSNFPPELIHNLPDVFFDEDTVLRNAFRLSDYFIDIDSNVLFYTNGTKFINATINENLTVDFSAPENWYGFEIVTFRATDPIGALAEDKILVVVVPVNDAPTIKSIPTQEKGEGDEWLLDLLQYIDDVDNNASELIITIQSEAGQGYVTLVGTILMFQYPEGIREDIITITVSDGELEASRSFIVNIKSSQRVAPSIWDLIPWPWVFLFLIAGTGGAFVFYKKKSRYWVYEAFLIHEDGLPIAHASKEESLGLDNVVVSGMFTAVQNFINDTFSEQTSEDDWELDEMKFGEHKILIERSKPLYLAVIFEGYGSKLRHRVKKLLRVIDENYGTVFEDWDGDMSNLEDIKGMIASLIIKKGRHLGSEGLPSQSQEEARSEEFESNAKDLEVIKKVGVEELEEFLEGVEKTLPGYVGAEEMEIEEIQVLVCPVCGKEIGEKVNKCPRCGVEFTELEDVLPPSPLKPENGES